MPSGRFGARIGDRLFQNTEIAFKYKMSAVQAALGLAQMERIDDLVAACFPKTAPC